MTPSVIPSSASQAAMDAVVHGLELCDGNRRPDFLIHGNLTPLFRRNEAIPIERGCTGENPVKVVGIFLRLLVTLTTARRATVPIGEFRPLAVIQLGNFFGPNGLLVNSVESKIPDKTQIQGVVRVQGRNVPPAEAGCPVSVDGSDVARVRRRRNRIPTAPAYPPPPRS